MENDQEGAGHGDEEEEALSEIADALFDDVVYDPDCCSRRSLFGWVRDLFGDAEGVCVERSLRNETVGEGDS